MKYLLDTHTYIWFICDDRRLSPGALKAIENSANEIYISAAVIWEIAIKSGIGKIQLRYKLDDLIAKTIQDYRFHPLPISIPHSIKINSLPAIHRDPFDRMLVAQCLVEGLTLITSDEIIKKYKVKTVW